MHLAKISSGPRDSCTRLAMQRKNLHYNSIIVAIDLNNKIDLIFIKIIK